MDGETPAGPSTPMLETPALVRGGHHGNQADRTTLKEIKDSQALTRIVNLLLKYGYVSPETWESIFCVRPL